MCPPARTQFAALFLLFSCVACLQQAPHEDFESTQSHASRLVFSSDDRQDAYSYANPSWAAQSLQHSAAMVRTERLNTTDPQNVRFNAPTLGQQEKLCSDERFVNQLVAASCSATLIAPDLVLTAGHCFDAHPCEKVSFVFGYAMQEQAALRQVTAQDVYACAEVLVQQWEGGYDHAVARLDRPVVGRTPAVIRPGYHPVEVGAPLVLEGYPTGLPLKIADNARVLDARAAILDYFATDVDGLRGNSGGGVFLQQTGELVGIHVRGAAANDYCSSDAACNRLWVVDDAFFAKPNASYASRAVQELCALAPGYSFCHCGDGSCDASLAESTRTCNADCGASCGDGACTGGEDAVSCYADCGRCGNAVCEPQERQTGSCCADCGANSTQVCPGHDSVTQPALGDVNADGRVTIVDAMIVGQRAAGLEPPFEPRAADVDCNGKIDVLDALQIARSTAGLLEVFPCEQIRQVSVGNDHTCVVRKSGDVQCWGYGENGSLGYASVSSIGDDEPASAAANVYVGGSTVRIASGGGHTCAVLSTGSVRCWGSNSNSQLGRGVADVFGESLGDTEHPGLFGDLELGAKAVDIAAGVAHTCVLTTEGNVRCWGVNAVGILGQGHVHAMRNQPLANLSAVAVGGTAVQLDAGYTHSCVVLGSGGVRCWGFSAQGALGYPGVINVGDDELPADMPTVDVGGLVTQVATGYDHTCALLDNGSLRCWGNNDHGQLGYGHTDSVGREQTPASRNELVDVGGPVVQIVAGNALTCALLENQGRVKCWGAATSGQLGNLSTEDIGDDESPSGASDVVLGRPAAALSAMNHHVCALLDDGTLRCWGDGSHGQLGMATTSNAPEPVTVPLRQ
jgi:alpha-tubulin suppressor-like RCC1 family protein/V8-like Glu-specific endopeptidase